MQVEVVYITPEKQALIACEVAANATVIDAIEASLILKQFPEIDLNTQKVGIFSRAATLETPLEAGDRVEIYRPLIIDPKEARRLRAKK